MTQSGYLSYLQNHEHIKYSYKNEMYDFVKDNFDKIKKDKYFIFKDEFKTVFEDKIEKLEIPNVDEFKFDINEIIIYTELVYPDDYDGFLDENYKEVDIKKWGDAILSYTNTKNNKTIKIRRDSNGWYGVKIEESEDK